MDRLSRGLGKARKQWLPLLLAPPALLAVMLNAWDFVTLWLDHDRTVEESGEQCLGLAREVARYLAGSVQAVEVHITDHVEPAAARYLTGKPDRAVLQGAFRLTAQRLPQITAILVFDRDGRLRETSRKARPPGLEIGDEAFFRRHRDDGADRSVFVAALDPSLPESNSSRWQLQVASRIVDDQGDFAGLVVASLDTEALFAVIGEMKMVTGAAVRIFDGDMRMLVNHPRDFTLIGRVFDHTRTVADWRRTRGELVGRIADPTDGSPEIGAFRQIEPYTLTVSVGLAEDLALAEWWRELAILLGTAVIFLLVSVWGMRHRLAHWVLHTEHEVEERHGFMDGDGV